MAEQTNIEWCDSTFNAWTGCQAVSPGCDNCFAAQWAKRSGRDFAVRKRTKTWGDPVKWNAQPFVQCAACGWRGEQRNFMGTTGWTMCPVCSCSDWHGTRRRVFCNSLGDWLDNQVPIAVFVDFLDLVRLTRNLDWLLLSKRIGAFKLRIGQALSFVIDCKDRRDLAHWIVNWLDGDHPPANVLVGATVVDQAEADRDIPKLLTVPASQRFLSIEPMLGPISFEGLFANPARCNDGTNALEEVAWVIVGGESLHGARPMHPEWARRLRDQCAATGVPFLFKQWGEFVSAEQAACGLQECYDKSTTGGWVEPSGAFTLGEAAEPHSDGAAHVFKVGKKAAGRLLDGVEHNGFPGPFPGTSRESP